MKATVFIWPEQRAQISEWDTRYSRSRELGQEVERVEDLEIPRGPGREAIVLRVGTENVTGTKFDKTGHSG